MAPWHSDAAFAALLAPCATMSDQEGSGAFRELDQLSCRSIITGFRSILLVHGEIPTGYGAAIGQRTFENLKVVHGHCTPR